MRTSEWCEAIMGVEELDGVTRIVPGSILGRMVSRVISCDVLEGGRRRRAALRNDEKWFWHS